MKRLSGSQKRAKRHPSNGGKQMRPPSPYIRTDTHTHMPSDLLSLSLPTEVPVLLPLSHKRSPEGVRREVGPASDNAARSGGSKAQSWHFESDEHAGS